MATATVLRKHKQIPQKYGGSAPVRSIAAMTAATAFNET